SNMVRSPMQRSTSAARFTKPRPCNNGVNMPMLLAALMMTFQLKITTDGGFTGRGLGQLSTDGQKMTTERCDGAVTSDERKQLAAAIDAAKKLKWRDSYGHAHPHGVP